MMSAAVLVLIVVVAGTCVCLGVFVKAAYVEGRAAMDAKAATAKAVARWVSTGESQTPANFIFEWTKQAANPSPFTFIDVTEELAKSARAESARTLLEQTGLRIVTQRYGTEDKNAGGARIIRGASDYTSAAALRIKN